MVWVLLVLAYGIIKGLREVLKKKALERSSVIEVLFLYTFISFLIVAPEAGNAFPVTPKILALIAVKSFIIFLAWLFSFRAVGHLPISFYGPLDLSRVLFATLLGLFVLGETMGIAQWAGFVLVIGGLFLLKFTNTGKNGARTESYDRIYIWLTLLSCLLNAVSGLMDKLLMSDPAITDTILQFWYMLFLVLYYIIYIIIKKPSINWKGTLKNYWVWILAVLFVIADRCLFIANSYPESRVTVMTLIKQSGCLVTILCGKFVFKEKNIGKKLVCTLIILCGIVISVLFPAH